MYDNGEGVHTDKVQAYAWAELASSSAPKFRQAAALRDKIAAKLSRAQLAKAQLLSRELQGENPRHALRHDVIAKAQQLSSELEARVQNSH